MIKKTLASLLSLIVISAISVTGAEAATTSPTATVGGICVKAGAVTSIAGKSYTCIKVLSGKLVWALTSTTTAAKPQVSGGAGGEGEGGTGENQGGGNAARQATRRLNPNRQSSGDGSVFKAMSRPSSFNWVSQIRPKLAVVMWAQLAARDLAACFLLDPNALLGRHVAANMAIWLEPLTDRDRSDAQGARQGGLTAKNGAGLADCFYVVGAHGTR